MPSMDTRTCWLCGHRKDTWECKHHPILKETVCDVCLAPRSYDTKNTQRVGRPSEHVPPFSVEFEVAAPCYTLSSRLERALLLIKYGFLRTEDDSVDDEYKSPIFQSLRAFYKPLGAMHLLRDLVMPWCGTHLHVTLRQKKTLVPIQDRVFGPLLAHLAANTSETEAFWGRTLCRYAAPSSATRYACFSLWSKHDTLEYRLPRFRTAQQYLAIVRFCLHMTTFLSDRLNPESPLFDTPEHMADGILAIYRHALAHPVNRLPLLTKGVFAHV